MKDKIYKKELSIGDMISRSWDLYKTNFKLIFYITLIVYLPINIILSLFTVEQTYESIKTYLRVIQILEILFGVIATMGIALLIKYKIDNKNIGLKSIFKKSLSRWPASIGTQIITGILLICLYLLLIIPGIIFTIYWMFIVLVVILNNKSGINALKYSGSVVNGRWWKCLGYSLFIFLFSILSIIVLSIVLTIPYFFIPENLALNLILDTLIDITYSYFTVLWVVFYINFEATKKKVIQKKKK